MVYNGKIRLLSGSALVLCLLAGCSMPSMPTSISDLYGKTRTVPEGSDVQFGGRRTPEFNPGGTSPAPASPESRLMTPIPAGNPVSDVSVRRVPVENKAVEEKMIAPQVVMSAPVQPVSVAPAQPFVLTQPIQPIAAVHPVPAAPIASTNNSQYPVLANVPPVPSYTSKDQTRKEFHSLTAERDLSESARVGLMADRDATVLTAPASSAPTPVLADASTLPPHTFVLSASPAKPVEPAEAPPVQAREDKGFNGWLHRTFASDDKKKTTAARQRPSENTQAPAIWSNDLSAPPRELMANANARDEIAPGSSAREVSPGIVLINHPAPAPAVHDLSALPVVHPAPVIVSSAPVIVPAAQSQAELEPVHLHPPRSSDVTSSEHALAPLPPVQAPEQVASTAPEEAPIQLVAPQASQQAHYLADSRYAARRMHDDDTN